MNNFRFAVSLSRILLLAVTLSLPAFAERARYDTSGGWSAVGTPGVLPSNIYAYTTPDNLPKGNVWFITEKFGSVWLSGDSALIAKANPSNLSQWSLMNSGIPSDVEINWLEFVDAQTIYAAGGNGIIYKTTNGGGTWSLSYQNPAATNFINIITFFDANHGVACGDGLTSAWPLAFLETTNGGLSWNNNNTFLVGTANYSIARFAPPSSAFLAGYNNSGGSLTRGIWRSTNLGSSWSFATIGSGTNKDSTISTPGIDFKNSLTGIACRSDSTFWSTSDGGVTWQQVGQRAPTFFYYPSFVGGTNTAMCGGQKQAAIAEVNLDNRTFTVQRKDTSDPVFKSVTFTYVSFTSLTHGHMSNGGKLRTFFSTQAPTGVKGNEISPMRFDLEQNYPNPFNPSTTISYQLLVPGDVTLKVVDLLGREVAMLVRERQTAGHHSVRWNAGGFPSGMYFLELTAGAVRETRKMILEK